MFFYHDCYVALWDCVTVTVCLLMNPVYCKKSMLRSAERIPGLGQIFIEMDAMQHFAEKNFSREVGNDCDRGWGVSGGLYTRGSGAEAASANQWGQWMQTLIRNIQLCTVVWVSGNDLGNPLRCFLLFLQMLFYAFMNVSFLSLFSSSHI